MLRIILWIARIILSVRLLVCSINCTTFNEQMIFTALAFLVFDTKERI